MEFWQLGVYLKSDLPSLGFDMEQIEAEKHTLAERAAKIRGEEPPSDEPVDLTAQIAKQMGINFG